MAASTAKAVTTLVLGDEGGFQIPVSLKKVTTKSEISLESASPKGNPLTTSTVGGTTSVTSDLMTGEVVSRDEIRKGIFKSKPKKTDKTTWGEFVEVKKDDLEAIDAATKIESFVVADFIPLKDVPFERVTDAYFLAPAEGMGAKPLVLLARALKKTKKAGVFKMSKSTRQYLAVVYEHNGGLIVNTLTFSSDFSAVREASEALSRQDVKIHPSELAAATQLVDELSTDASVVDGFEDDLLVLRADLIERALAGKPVPRQKTKVVEPVITDDLEDLLRASLARMKPKASVAASSR